MDKLYELDKLESISNINSILEKEKKVNLTNVKGGLQGFITYLVYEKAKQENRDVLYIVPTEKEARDKYYILSRFIKNISLLSPEQTHLFLSDAFSLFQLQDREKALKRALNDCPLLTVCPLEALFKKLPNPEEQKDNYLQIKKGETYNYQDIINTLVNFGYERTDLTEAVGQFSVRGEIIDIFPISEAEPLRIDFFDDEVESINYFDELTQRSLSEVEQTTLTPLSEDWINSEDRDKALHKIFTKYKNNSNYDERLETLENNTLVSNSILAAFTNNDFDYMQYLKDGSDGKDPIIVWASPDESLEIAKEFYNKVEADYQALGETGEVFPDEIQRYFTINQLVKRINEYPLLKLHLFTTNTRKEKTIDMDSRIIENFAGQPKLLADFIRNRVNHEYFIRFFVKNEQGKETIENFLKDYNIPLITSEDNLKPGVRIAMGEITEGFELAQDKIVFLNESEFFKKERRERKRKKDTKQIDRFTDLKKGDLVVHDDYGIGRYSGLTQVDFGDTIKDMMKIEYAGADVLYIPVDGMDAVQVYIGNGESEAPPLNEIGTSRWRTTKNRAKKMAEDMADELIQLYSTRQQMEGYAFSPDTVWQQQFEDAFPFEETDDQLQSIAEIKEDMEKNTAMDRLLCGDVGFGKTEVAFRAAFKAVMDGKQVALLVPTTVLSQQHYLTAIERFKNFPINIEILNRFKTKKEVDEVLERLKNGEIDILIGTHRILSNDVEFKDLGLLIVDEEQRFGVRSKERIKQIKENIDVLTLSATPIPRTLHMSLIDVRDMSVLEEPPSGRKPIQTYVMNYNPTVIRDAIEREINRNGQVYYIHNRVHDIDQVTAELQQLVPSARIINAHGQMSGRELENVMLRFLNKEYDVLVATTIVENGLDVRNANTMIVEDGDHFGLSQLYQLRGRVGRSERQAYTYITHKKQKLNEDAKKRLKALRDFTAFGSGFKVAMRDLEIRGAGNILGKQQSGHMVKIGYELYNRILRQAINEKLTGVKETELAEASIQSNKKAYVPKEYIVGDEVRYDIYKKISRLHTWEDYEDLIEELSDRFGKVPQQVQDLMLISMIKNISTYLNINQIRQDNRDVKIIFNSKEAGSRFNRYFKKSEIELKNLKTNAGKPSKPAWLFELTEEDNNLLKELFNFLDQINNTKDKLQGGKT